MRKLQLEQLELRAMVAVSSFHVNLYEELTQS